MRAPGKEKNLLQMFSACDKTRIPVGLASTKRGINAKPGAVLLRLGEGGGLVSFSTCSSCASRVGDWFVRSESFLLFLAALVNILLDRKRLSSAFLTPR